MQDAGFESYHLLPSISLEFITQDPVVLARYWLSFLNQVFTYIQIFLNLYSFFCNYVISVCGLFQTR